MIAVDELAAMLRDQAEAVARAYCSPAGAHVERGQFYALNPGRADRSVGSFFVTVSGPYCGRWRDMATGESGDMLDLIQLALGCDRVGAIREAKAFLGIDDARARDPARLAARRREMEAAAAKRREAEAEQARAKRAAAFRLWTDAKEDLPLTPVDHYLRARGIDLLRLGRQPRALRYARACPYRQVDRETGEVIEGRAPAMLGFVTGPDGTFAAVHRTWLGQERGVWRKLGLLPKPKKVLGSFGRGAIRLWRGRDGDRPGRPLADAPPGSRAVVCEGIEDGLAIALLRPDLRVLAAVSLGNIGQVALPPAIAEVIVAGDRDTHPEARAALERACADHAAAGRVVRLWLSPVGKDAGDLIAALSARRPPATAAEGAA